MTNRQFTDDAAWFGRDQGIKMINERTLRRWATWGDPVADVLGLSLEDTLDLAQPAAA